MLNIDSRIIRIVGGGEQVNKNVHPCIQVPTYRDYIIIIGIFTTAVLRHLNLLSNNNICIQFILFSYYRYKPLQYRLTNSKAAAALTFKWNPMIVVTIYLIRSGSSRIYHTIIYSFSRRQRRGLMTTADERSRRRRRRRRGVSSVVYRYARVMGGAVRTRAVGDEIRFWTNGVGVSVAPGMGGAPLVRGRWPRG